MHDVGSTSNERAAAVEKDARWDMVLRRQSAADGVFVYAVETTGIYCRPSCPSRLAKPRNVRFYDSCEEAERAGFRACRRCKPNAAALPERRAAAVALACRRIEASEEPPALEALAAEVGFSPSHFHRMFRSVTGVTPKGYAAAHRARRMREALARRGTSITEAIYEAGFNSSGRFYEKSNAMLGMTPTAYRTGGMDTEIRFAVGESSLGSVLVACTDRGVCAILLGRDPNRLARDLQDTFPKAKLVGGERRFEDLVAHVVGFVEHPREDIDLPLDIRGTAFQQRVWEALRSIPPGVTATYAQIAERIGRPQAARAVGRACAANRLAVAIPCHRVVKRDGALSGYRWGVERKRALLDRESPT